MDKQKTPYPEWPAVPKELHGGLVQFSLLTCLSNTPATLKLGEHFRSQVPHVRAQWHNIEIIITYRLLGKNAWFQALIRNLQVVWPQDSHSNLLCLSSFTYTIKDTNTYLLG